MYFPMNNFNAEYKAFYLPIVEYWKYSCDLLTFRLSEYAQYLWNGSQLPFHKICVAAIYININQSTVLTVLSLQRNHQSQYICNQQYLILNSLFSTQMKSSILLHASIKPPLWSWVQSKTLISVCSDSWLLLFIAITCRSDKNERL